MTSWPQVWADLAASTERWNGCQMGATSSKSSVKLRQKTFCCSKLGHCAVPRLLAPGKQEEMGRLQGLSAHLGNNLGAQWPVWPWVCHDLSAVPCSLPISPCLPEVGVTTVPARCMSAGNLRVCP